MICLSKSVGSKKGHGKTRNKSLKADIGKSKTPLPVEFDRDGHNTYVAVGENGNSFVSLIGTIVGRLPFHYPSWTDMPAEVTEPIIDELQV